MITSLTMVRRVPDSDLTGEYGLATGYAPSACGMWVVIFLKRCYNLLLYPCSLACLVQYGE